MVFALVIGSSYIMADIIFYLRRKYRMRMQQFKWPLIFVIMSAIITAYLNPVLFSYGTLLGLPAMIVLVLACFKTHNFRLWLSTVFILLLCFSMKIYNGWIERNLFQSYVSNLHATLTKEKNYLHSASPNLVKQALKDFESGYTITLTDSFAHIKEIYLVANKNLYKMDIEKLNASPLKSWFWIQNPYFRLCGLRIVN